MTEPVTALNLPNQSVDRHLVRLRLGIAKVAVSTLARAARGAGLTAYHGKDMFGASVWHRASWSV